MQHIVVYCGSNYGERQAYFEAARQTGTEIARRGAQLVYGGGKVGLMGSVADAVLAAGGSVTGVIPTFLMEKEVAHPRLSHLIETADMPQRKQKMIELGDAFIALPGGIGTYEELFEILSLAQLGQFRDRPIGLLNTKGFFDPLLAMLQRTADDGFMPSENFTLLCVDSHPAALLDKMADYRPQHGIKWKRPAWMQAAGAVKAD